MFSKIRIETRYTQFAAALALTAATLWGFAAANAQLPTAVFSHNNQVTGLTTVFTPGPTAVGGAAGTGHIGANSRGDMFYIDAQYGYPKPSFLVEVPVNGGPYLQLIANMGNGARGIAVDPKNNIYVTDNNNKNIYFIPFVNGGYPANMDATVVLKCTLPVSTNTTTCKNPFTLPAAIGYYLQAQDIAVDAIGNAYLVDIFDGITGGTPYRLLKASSTTGAITIIVDGLPKTGTPQITADPAGNVYYVDGTNAYYFATGATYNATTNTPPGFGVGLKNAASVGMDASGNLFIGDTGNSRILEIPAVAGVRTNTNQFLVANQAAGSGIGADGYGNLYYGGPSIVNVNHLGVGSLTFGSAVVGTTTAAQQLDLTFSTPQTFGSFQIFSSAGTAPFTVATNTCTVGKAYPTGGSCSITVTYTPTIAGFQAATIRAYDNNVVQIAEGGLGGVGLAPVFSIDPGIASSIGSGWKAPSAITTDPAGNTYVADSTNGIIYKNGTSILTGFVTPSAVAVDSIGNVYLAESVNHRILKVPYTGTAFGTPAVLYTGVGTGTIGMVLDSVGNLYVADSGNARVVLLSNSGNLPIGSLVTSVGSGFTSPVALALDGTNNLLYISDLGAKQVVQLGLQTGVTTSVVTGMTTPAGVAVDPGGNLYAIDAGRQTVVRVPNTAGTLNPALQNTLTPVVTNPQAIAIDPAGNVYEVDMKNAAVVRVNRSTGSLAFGFVDLSSVPVLSAILSNSGTSALSLPTPFYTATGNSGSFVVQSSSTCANGKLLAVGASCQLDEAFSPPNVGSQTATLNFTSTGGSGSLSLTGTGFHAVVATVAGPATTNYGSAALYTVTAATDGTYAVSVTGTAAASTSVVVTGGQGTFSLPGVGAGSYTIAVTLTTASIKVVVQKAPLTVTTANTSRSFGAVNPVFTSIVSGAVNGDVLTATATTTAALTSPVGTYPIVPSASGSGIANYSVTAVNGVLTVVQAASSGSVSASPNIFYPGAQTVLTASIRSVPGGGTPTGVVTFYANSSVLGTSALTAGTATLPTPLNLTSQIYTIFVIYSGDSNFFPSTSPNFTVTVNPPDFAITSSVAALTLASGQTSTATLTVSTAAGSPTFTQDVTFACAGLPAEASCSYSPATVNPGTGTATSTLTIHTVSSTTSMLRKGPWQQAGGTTFVALALFCLNLRKRRIHLRLVALVGFCAMAVLSIGGCSSKVPFVVTSTPVGTSSVLVTANSAGASINHIVTITVTITK